MTSISNDVYTGLVNSTALLPEISMRLMAVMSQYGVVLNPVNSVAQSFNATNSVTICSSQTFDSSAGSIVLNLYTVYTTGNVNTLTFKLTINYCGLEYSEVLKTVYGNDAINLVLFNINCARTNVLNNSGLLSFLKKFASSVFSNMRVGV
jgi:hypothetical protein